jgi:hypothetical protein
MLMFKFCPNFPLFLYFVATGLRNIQFLFSLTTHAPFISFAPLSTALSMSARVSSLGWTCAVVSVVPIDDVLAPSASHEEEDLPLKLPDTPRVSTRLQKAESRKA